MKKQNRNIYWIIAGIINSFTALLHAIGGQVDLVSPLMKSNLGIQSKTEWLGVWHIVTIILFVSSYYLLKNGLNSTKRNSEAVQLIGILYILFSAAFIMSSLYMKTFAPQWVLLLPIGVLSLIRT
jgi:heme/copper-type cytochrome/quinol oxidase subunit 3